MFSVGEYLFSLRKTIFLKVFSKNIHLDSFKGVFSFGAQLRTKAGGSIYLKKIRLEKNSSILAYGGKIHLGDRLYMNRNSIIVSQKSITIGEHCIIGPNVCIYDHDHAFDKNGFIIGGYKADPIVIEDHCWIGADSVILRGAHIGKNSVIGAGCVISGFIPPHSIVRTNRELRIEELH